VGRIRRQRVHRRNHGTVPGSCSWTVMFEAPRRWPRRGTRRARGRSAPWKKKTRIDRTRGRSGIPETRYDACRSFPNQLPEKGSRRCVGGMRPQVDRRPQGRADPCCRRRTASRLPIGEKSSTTIMGPAGQPGERRRPAGWKTDLWGPALNMGITQNGPAVRLPDS